jgi:sodium transport system ATP-binding protein
MGRPAISGAATYRHGLFSGTGNVISSNVTASAIAIHELEKWFPPTHSGWRAFLQPFASPTTAALGGVSLEVSQGEAVALLGANGAGKTTLLRILATLLLPTKGTACIAGNDAVREAAAVRKQLGYHAGSDLGFYARLTGRENLRFFGQLNHLTDNAFDAQIRALGDRFQLTDVLDRQVRSLSSGTIQRLSLLRALLHQPKVLLLDEPTRSMDAIAAIDFRRFLKSEVVGQHGASLLFSSHSLQEIELLADRVVVLKQGKVVAVDTLQALKAKYHVDSLEKVFLKSTGSHSGGSEETATE